MKAARVLGLATALTLSGCANLDSIYRPLDIGGTGTNAVAVDVKQRAIYSSPRKVMGADGASIESKVICAEPSPDALSAYSASGGITAVIQAATAASGPGSKEQAQAAFAAGEAAASIGLRTQSIQLLRDGLFANCLAYLNYAVDGDKFYELQRRSQNFTLGLLAIEQLTGATKADQAALGTSSSGGTGGDADKETAALDGAQKTQNDAKTDLAKAQSALKDSKAAKDASQAKLDAAKKDQADPKNAADPGKATAATAVESAAADVTAKQKDVDAKQIDVDTATRAATNADSQVAAAQERLLAAQMRVRASASGMAQLAAAGGARAVVTDKVATAVVDIVKTVLDSSGRGESCFFLVESLMRDAGLADNPNFQATVQLACSDREKQLLAATLRAAGKPDAASRFLRNVAPSLVPSPMIKKQ